MSDGAWVVVVVLVIVLLCGGAVVADDWQRARCARAGGTARYIGDGGYLCFTPDGRVIDP